MDAVTVQDSEVWSQSGPLPQQSSFHGGRAGLPTLEGTEGQRGANKEHTSSLGVTFPSSKLVDL